MLHRQDKLKQNNSKQFRWDLHVQKQNCVNLRNDEDMFNVAIANRNKKESATFEHLYPSPYAIFCPPFRDWFMSLSIALRPLPLSLPPPPLFFTFINSLDGKQIHSLFHTLSHSSGRWESVLNEESHFLPSLPFINSRFQAALSRIQDSVPTRKRGCLDGIHCFSPTSIAVSRVLICISSHFNSPGDLHSLSLLANQFIARMEFTEFQ